MKWCFLRIHVGSFHCNVMKVHLSHTEIHEHTGLWISKNTLLGLTCKIIKMNQLNKTKPVISDLCQLPAYFVTAL